MLKNFSAPETPAEKQRDILIGSLVALARATINEPKTEDTDRVLRAGLKLAQSPKAERAALERMNAIVQTEKHRVAPNCASCVMRCGNTDDYDMSRLWSAEADIRALKLRLLEAVFAASLLPAGAETQKAVDDGLFILAEDWEADMLAPAVEKIEAVITAETKKQ